MIRSLVVAVVCGGPSTEAEVSRASARGVADALVQAGHRAVRLELDPYLPESLRTGGFDVVFPAVHGAVGEDGCLQGLLEILELPYVGADVLASAVAMQKPLARTLFAEAGLPVARGFRARAGEAPARAFAERALAEIGARLVVKPAASGSAIGVARLDEGVSVDLVASAIEAAWAVDSAALIEHFVRGKEVTCGVLDLHGAAGGAVAFPPTEISAPKDAFYTYEARYAPGRSEHTCPAALPPKVLARVQDAAVRAHVALGVRDLSRVDFVVGDVGDPDRVILLELNTLPGFTATSLYPEAAGIFGLAMPALCDALARSAASRGPSRRNAAKPLPR